MFQKNNKIAFITRTSMLSIVNDMLIVIKTQFKIHHLLLNMSAAFVIIS